MRTARIAAGILAGLLGAGAALAQPLAYGPRDGGEREEGILDELVAGRDFELLGVQLVGASAAPGGDDLYLVVPGSVSAELTARVRELPSNYMMKPRRFVAGQPFQWSRAAVIEPAGLSVERLAALVSHRERRLYFPAFLGGSGRIPSTPVYRFTYEMSAPWKLEWAIYRDGGGRTPVARGSERGSEGLARIEWDGTDASGEAAPPGSYLLQGTLFLRKNPTTRNPVDVAFQKYR